MAQLQPGVLLGKYQIEEQLGRGAMSVVYKALQTGVSRHVAIKVMLGHLVSQPGFAERFKREARAVAKLQHRNIVALYDFDDQDSTAYIVMEYVHGHSLGQLIKGPMPVPQAINFVSQLADALDYAHGLGVIHRDVKPGNMMIEEGTDRLVLMDFGFSKIVEENTQLTRPGTNLGTPHFMSPEQVLGKPVDNRTDIYAMGVVLYQLLTGKLPYSGESAIAVLKKVLQESMPRPSLEVPSIPPAVEQVVLKATAKNRDERYETARAFKTALLDASTPSARPAAPAASAPPARGLLQRPTASTPTPPAIPPVSPPSTQPAHAPIAQRSQPVNTPVTAGSPMSGASDRAARDAASSAQPNQTAIPTRAGNVTGIVISVAAALILVILVALYLLGFLH